MVRSIPLQQDSKTAVEHACFAAAIAMLLEHSGV